MGAQQLLIKGKDKIRKKALSNLGNSVRVPPSRKFPVENRDLI